MPLLENALLGCRPSPALHSRCAGDFLHAWQPSPPPGLRRDKAYDALAECLAEASLVNFSLDAPSPPAAANTAAGFGEILSSNDGELHRPTAPVVSSLLMQAIQSARQPDASAAPPCQPEKKCQETATDSLLAAAAAVLRLDRPAEVSETEGCSAMTAQEGNDVEEADNDLHLTENDSATGTKKKRARRRKGSKAAGEKDEDCLELPEEPPQFTFPTPAAIEGVKSRKKAILLVDQVSFKHANDKTVVLSDLTFSLSQTSRVLVVGANKSGKSTLAKL